VTVLDIHPDHVLRHAAGTRLRQLPEGSTTVQSADGVALALDQTALALWELCDGETTVSEITAAVCSLFSGPSDLVEKDISDVLTALVEAGLLVPAADPRPLMDSVVGQVEAP
jgi:Coenzyme PQQ synthesis protein D (PqqD)